MDSSTDFTDRNYVAIEGPIGVGKTSLMNQLCASFSCRAIPEIVDNNPYLPKFHQDIKRYAFLAQIFFLQSRLLQQKEIAELASRNRLVVSDYLFPLKERIFVELFLSDDEMDTYWRLRDCIDNPIPQPGLVVYLFASLEVLMNRIEFRNRSCEAQVDPHFVVSLQRKYEEYLLNNRKYNILRIDTSSMDFVNNKLDYRDIVCQIKSKLGSTSMTD